MDGEIINPTKVGNGFIDQIQNRACRPERHRQRHIAEIGLNGFGAAGQLASILIHNQRVCTLKGIDRLFEIPNGKHRSRQACCPRCDIGACPLAIKKFINQPPQQFPLCRAGILRLINQKMLDTIV